jgi:hypothetical protein
MQERDTFRVRLIAAIAVFIVLAASLQAVDITLTWTPATTNTDGSVITGLSNYRLHYGFSSAVYTHSIDVGNANAVTLTNIDATKTYFFTVTCYNESGNESAFSTELVSIVSDTSDPDNDGMPDAWEIRHFGTPETPAGGASADSDGDGVPNLGEYVAGTSPTNENSQPLIRFAVTNHRAVVAFDAPMAEGPSYGGKVRYVTLEQCDNLSDGNWQPVAGYENIEARNQAVSYAHPGGATQRFYRSRMRLE